MGKRKIQLVENAFEKGKKFTKKFHLTAEMDTNYGTLFLDQKSWDSFKKHTDKGINQTYISHLFFNNNNSIANNRAIGWNRLRDITKMRLILAFKLVHIDGNIEKLKNAVKENSLEQFFQELDSQEFQFNNSIQSSVFDFQCPIEKLNILLQTGSITDRSQLLKCTKVKTFAELRKIADNFGQYMEDQKSIELKSNVKFYLTHYERSI